MPVVARSCFLLLVDHDSSGVFPDGSEFFEIGCTYNSKHKSYHPYGGKADTKSEPYTDVITREWREETGLESVPDGDDKTFSNVQNYEGVDWDQTFVISVLSNSSVSSVTGEIIAKRAYEREKLLPLSLRCVKSRGESYDKLYDLWSEYFRSKASDSVMASGAMIASLCFANFKPGSW